MTHFHLDRANWDAFERALGKLPKAKRTALELRAADELERDHEAIAMSRFSNDRQARHPVDPVLRDACVKARVFAILEAESWDLVASALRSAGAS